MNAHTAETLLRCHRAEKPADSRMQKAIRWAESDPETRQKLKEQMDFDQQVVEAIHFIKPPEDLRQKLTALGSKPSAGRHGLRKRMIDPAVLSALVGVAVIVGIIAFFVLDHMAKFPGRESVERMIPTPGKMTGLEFEPVTTTTNQLGDWLYMRGYEGYEVPPEIAALSVIASRVFRLDGKPIAQFAMERHDSLVYEFHASDFGVQLPQDGDWRFLDQDDWIAAIRQHGDHCVMILLRGTKSEMKDFLKSLPNK
jgi:hypothetical protein